LIDDSSEEEEENEEGLDAYINEEDLISDEYLI